MIPAIGSIVAPTIITKMAYLFIEKQKEISSVTMSYPLPFRSSPARRLDVDFLSILYRK
jgi:hypothetical protein